MLSAVTYYEDTYKMKQSLQDWVSAAGFEVRQGRVSHFYVHTWLFMRTKINLTAGVWQQTTIRWNGTDSGLGADSNAEKAKLQIMIKAPFMTDISHNAYSPSKELMSRCMAVRGLGFTCFPEQSLPAAFCTTSIVDFSAGILSNLVWSGCVPPHRSSSWEVQRKTSNMSIITVLYGLKVWGQYFFFFCGGGRTQSTKDALNC